MPGFYQEGEYDVSGTIVGVVEKSTMLDGKTIKPGDTIIGIASSGLHTNGYSLARKILFEKLKLKPTSRLPGIRNSVGKELLNVHVSYGPLVQKLLKQFNRGNNRPRHQRPRSHHWRRLHRQHSARAAKNLRRPHSKRFLACPADFSTTPRQRRRRRTGIVSSVQHGHRHDSYRRD